CSRKLLCQVRAGYDQNVSLFLFKGAIRTMDLVPIPSTLVASNARNTICENPTCSTKYTGNTRQIFDNYCLKTYSLLAKPEAELSTMICVFPPSRPSFISVLLVSLNSGNFPCCLIASPSLYLPDSQDQVPD